MAAATNNQHNITEANSLLLETLINMDPKGAIRRPPQQVLDELQKINQHCKVGHMLCRSRSPDFLLDILNRQSGGGSGQSGSMPWLADLVESSEGSLGVLPVQCLCEFLLSCQADKDEEEDAALAANKRRKERQLLVHLQVILLLLSCLLY